MSGEQVLTSHRPQRKVLSAPPVTDIAEGFCAPRRLFIATEVGEARGRVVVVGDGGKEKTKMWPF